MKSGPRKKNKKLGKGKMLKKEVKASKPKPKTINGQSGDKEEQKKNPPQERRIRSW